MKPIREERSTSRDLPPGRFRVSSWRVLVSLPPQPLAVGLPSFLSLNPGDELRTSNSVCVPAASSRAASFIPTANPLAAPGFPRKGPFGDVQSASNDLGEYRFANLRPGDYAVQVQPSNPIGNCDLFAARKPRIYVDESADRPSPPLRVDAGQTMIQPDFVMVSVTPHRSGWQNRFRCVSSFHTLAREHGDVTDSESGILMDPSRSAACLRASTRYTVMQLRYAVPRRRRLENPRR